ncbi:Rne/Rng family ribonuclease [Schaalia hyovaginalis]|uniref:Rne/Rng family ribonuclease n=1 Tax=Schaalia hyovaginalis TaxID=29316 RepID=UPI001F3D0325|nr:Rne/Rng family ribonuclease [Schaalia hyovaginalis]
MTTETNQSAPETPAASLLFQAPAFQAPVFQAAPPAPAPEPGAEEESPKPKRSRRKAKESPLESSEPLAEEAPEAEAPKRKRRTRKSAEAKEEPRAQDAVDESPADSDALGAAEADQGEPGEAEAEEAASTRRRRRRRTRPSLAEEEGDPADQVTALKGSTRLEAKKQRRKEGRREGRRRHGITESEFLARRESVKREMVIRDQDGLDQIAILEDGLLVEHYVARRTQKSMVGNIYLGRVQNVLPSMEAAFVDIGRGRNAVLYAGEVNWDAVGLEGKPRRIEAALKSGDPVLVQVTKDPIGHKGARLTSQITLAGRYLVLIPNGSMMGISRKLPDRERTRLKKILKAVVPAGSGVIVRTAAEGASEEQIRDDVARLTKQWADIEAKQTQTKSAPVLLRGEPELAVRVVRDIFNEDFSKLIIEGRETFGTVKEYVDELSPELSDRVEQWVGTEDAFHAHRIDEQLAKGMDRKVWLPSGGTLIIDRTEAMTVIDVNTGKYIGAGGTLEETVTRNNLEAAEEIVRQLRLRDIGGIIIVDFVDMVLESNRDLVLRRLVECLGRDRTRHQVTEITSLGLVQMTRKRVGEGLVEAFSTTCEACEGRGFIVHDRPVESSGAHDHTGGAPKQAKRKKQAEARRLDDEVEHEKAKQALSAIAAATRKAEEHAFEDAAPLESEPQASKADQEQPSEAPEGKGSRVRVKKEKTRAEAPEAAAAGAEEAQDDPRRDEPAAQTRQARPRRRRRAVATGVVDPSATEAVAALEAATAGAAIEAPEPRALSGKAPRGAKGASAGVEAAPSEGDASEATAAPTKKRRRRAVTSESMEPKAAPAVEIELPKKAVRVESAPLRSTSEIDLPEARVPAKSTPKRRRRVASTGIIDAG